MSPAKKAPEAVDPLARREELYAELEATAAYQETARDALAAITTKHGAPIGRNPFLALQRAIADVHIALARGQATEADLQKAKDELAAVQAEHADAVARNGVANAARARVREELAELHDEHAEAFIAAATPASQAAEAALQSLREAYVAALQAWDAAAEAWAPLVADVPELADVPPCPLAPVEVLDREARPPQLANGRTLDELRD